MTAHHSDTEAGCVQGEQSLRNIQPWADKWQRARSRLRGEAAQELKQSGRAALSASAFGKQPTDTSSQRLPVAAEMRGMLEERRSAAKSCQICKVLSVIVVLSLVAFISYLLLSQLGVFPPKQNTNLMRTAEACLPARPLHDELPRLMNLVGKVPEKVAVHLAASQRQRGKKEVIWQSPGDLSKGIEFKANGLVIKIPGKYFVYTQVVFYGSGCRGQAVYLSHELAKLSASYRTKTTLVRAMKTVCHTFGHKVSTSHGPDSSREPWYKTIYQGAIFELVEGEQVFSRVSGNAVRYVNTEEGMTYFGLFAL
ncbi:tumor necrosis factor-like [Stegostoma tigrinum]|uniref:tumor necrosis factor-like n=1 Tax=Stegostoma tigrinum TaxID=3053191 RepID=UPI00286FBF98|nr:tumor necrosis factor-like [Stegostoma tigrinum]